MNWDAIGAIAELLAALGVIVFFFCLATQIRQNTDQISHSIKAQQVASSQAIQASGHQVRSQIISEPALYLNGLRDSSSLSREQRVQFNMIATGVVMNLREICQLHHWGTLDPGLWALQRNLIQWLADQPGGRSAVEPFLDDPSEFGSELRRILETGAPAA